MAVAQWHDHECVRHLGIVGTHSQRDKMRTL
jgi:hypothetical protein